MTRRTLLKWISRSIAVACTAVVAIPAVGYVFTPLLRRRAGHAVVGRVARLSDLPPGQPAQFAVTGSRRDAWVVYPEETIGRVWILRQTDEQTPPEQAQIAAFTATCPHLGCTIQLDTSRDGFVCPCHKAVFDVSGKALGQADLGHRNPAPRDMDALECRVVQDPTSGQWWVEVKYEQFQYGLTEKVSMT